MWPVDGSHVSRWFRRNDFSKAARRDQAITCGTKTHYRLSETSKVGRYVDSEHCASSCLEHRPFDLRHRGAHRACETVITAGHEQP
jgi:hypothetical protein